MFKLVSWMEGDLSQFIVKADSDEEAIAVAMEANLAKKMDDEMTAQARDASTYLAEDIETLDMLGHLVNRDDYHGRVGNTLVFHD